MHLLYFVQYYPPEKASGLSIVTDLIEGFARYGWDVDVYIPTPTRGVSDEERKEYSKKRREVLFDGRLVIHRMPLYREGTWILQRTVRYSIFSLQCLIRGLLIPADVVFTGSGPPTQGIVGGIIHKVTKKKFVYNPQDLFPDSLIISGKASKNSMIVKMGRMIEKFAYHNADAIITITEDMAETIRLRTKDKTKIYTIRNWIDMSKTIPINRAKNRLFDEFNISRDKFWVVYAGNIGLLQGIDTIIEAAELLKNEEYIQFVIFGNGSEEEHIIQMIKAKKLQNVRILPLQPLDRVSEVYSLGDVSIVSGKPGTGSVGMPSKIWTIMATGTAIIGSFDLGSELDKTLSKAECGYCVEAGNAEKLAEAIKEMSVDLENNRKMSANARKYIEEKIDKDKAINSYIGIIEKCVEA